MFRSFVDFIENQYWNGPDSYARFSVQWIRARFLSKFGNRY